MSIVTRTGDSGHTALMYNRRVSKSHPRVEACGTVDELNAALGLARAVSAHGQSADILLSVQNDLVGLMGELATAAEDLPRYITDGFKQVTPDMTVRLERQVHEFETRGETFRGWATPGGSELSARLDLARTVARRAERRICALHETGELGNAEIIVYLNRLSDLLWLMARAAERSS